MWIVLFVCDEVFLIVCVVFGCMDEMCDVFDGVFVG